MDFLIDDWNSREQEFVNHVFHEVVFLAASTLSIIGCTIIIGTYYLYKDIRTPSRHIIVCISIADFFVALSNFISNFENPQAHLVCYVQSFVESTATVASFLWTMALAIFLNVLIVQKKAKLAESFIHPYFHLICWLLPVVINVVAICLNKLGNTHDMATSGWCWIAVTVQNISGSNTIVNKQDAVLWMTLNAKGIEILTYVVIFVLYLRIKCHLRNKIKNFDSEAERKSGSFVSHKTFQAAKTTDRKLIFIPIVLVILRIWGTARYFLFIFKKHNLNADIELLTIEKVLIILQAIGDNLIGAVNCILFCFLTPKVLNHMKETWKSLIKYFIRRKQSPIDTKEPVETTKLLSEAT